MGRGRACEERETSAGSTLGGLVGGGLVGSGEMREQREQDYSTNSEETRWTGAGESEQVRPGGSYRTKHMKF